VASSGGLTGQGLEGYDDGTGFEFEVGDFEGSFFVDPGVRQGYTVV